MSSCVAGLAGRQRVSYTSRAGLAGISKRNGLEQAPEAGSAERPRSSPHASPLKRAAGFILRLAAVAAAYFILAMAGFDLASVHPAASPIWGPSGVALAALVSAIIALPILPVSRVDFQTGDVAPRASKP